MRYLSVDLPATSARVPFPSSLSLLLCVALRCLGLPCGARLPLVLYGAIVCTFLNLLTVLAYESFCSFSLFAWLPSPFFFKLFFASENSLFVVVCVLFLLLRFRVFCISEGEEDKERRWCFLACLHLFLFLFSLFWWLLFVCVLFLLPRFRVFFISEGEEDKERTWCCLACRLFFYCSFLRLLCVFFLPPLLVFSIFSISEGEED